MRLVDRTINIGGHKPEDRWMERREFLKLALGFTAAAGALAAGAATTAQAAPMLPPQPNMVPPQDMPSAEPAIATQDDVDGMTAEQVQWRRRRHIGATMFARAVAGCMSFGRAAAGGCFTAETIAALR
ncbi:MAG: twin-arginine translocation signal domain-containing protein [Xanthobacteraceae bacterium]